METQINNPPPQDSSSGANTVLLVIIILLLAGFGFWWYYHRGRAPSNPAINVDVNLPTSSNSPGSGSSTSGTAQ